MDLPVWQTGSAAKGVDDLETGEELLVIGGRNKQDVEGEICLPSLHSPFHAFPSLPCSCCLLHCHVSAPLPPPPPPLLCPLQAPSPLIAMPSVLTCLTACSALFSINMPHPKLCNPQVGRNLLILGMVFCLANLAELCLGLFACAGRYACHSSGSLTTVGNCADISKCSEITALKLYTCVEGKQNVKSSCCTCIKCQSCITSPARREKSETLFGAQIDGNHAMITALCTMTQQLQRRVLIHRSCCNVSSRPSGMHIW